MVSAVDEAGVTSLSEAYIKYYPIISESQEALLPRKKATVGVRAKWQVPF